MGTQRIVVKEPGKPAEVREVTLDYPTMSDLVGGWIELVRIPLGDGLVLDMYLNEEGKIEGLPLNFYFPPSVGTLPMDCAVGPVFFCNSDSEGLSIGLTQAEIDAVLTWFSLVDMASV